MDTRTKIFKDKKEWEQNEIERAYKFYKSQVQIGFYNKKDILNQIENSYTTYIRDYIEDIIS